MSQNEVVTNIPTYNNGTSKNRRNLNALVGKYVDIKYNDELYKIYIQEYKNGKLKINDKYITSQNFYKGNFGIILNKRNVYKYKENDIINNLTIKEHIRLIKNNKEVYGYKYTCNKCGYNGESVKYHLENNRGCPVCCEPSVLIIREINSFGAIHENLVSVFKNKEDAYIYSYSSDKKITTKCPDCENEHDIRIADLHRYGFSCKKCGDNITYPNKFLRELLEQLKKIYLINYKIEYSPSWIGKKRYDGYLKYNNKEYIIEMDGGLGHGIRVFPNSNRTLSETIEADDYKDKKAIEHNIEMIRIDCDYKYNDRFEYINNSIINSKLSKIFDLTKINWNEVKIVSESNLFKSAYNLYNNETKNINIISNELGVSYQSALKYVKRASDLGLCNYIPNNYQNKKEGII